MTYFEKTQRLKLVAGLGISLCYLCYLVFVYFFTDAYPAGSLDTLYTFVLAFIIISYFVRENQRKHYLYPAHDMGFFMYMLMPVLVPYYLFKSRRVKGVLILLGLIALLLLSTWVDLLWLLTSNRTG